MRVGLLGDIHGNAAALSEVLAAARTEGIERLFVTGDFVGYYYDAGDVLAMLAEWPISAVRGNHDVMLIECLEDPAKLDSLTRKYGSGLRESIHTLPSDAIEFLKSLPQTSTFDCAGGRLVLAHGAPWDTNTYIYPDADEEVWDRLAEINATFVVLGHTHYQYSRRAGSTLVINPGSVGQPRDRKPGAAWSILDTETGAIEHRRESYDIEQVAADARRRDPDLLFLWTVLSRT